MQNHSDFQWQKGGKFVSDSAETVAGMYVIQNRLGDFIAAFEGPEAAVEKG